MNVLLLVFITSVNHFKKNNYKLIHEIIVVKI